MDEDGDTGIVCDTEFFTDCTQQCQILLLTGGSRAGFFFRGALVTEWGEHQIWRQDHSVPVLDPLPLYCVAMNNCPTTLCLGPTCLEDVTKVLHRQNCVSFLHKLQGLK